MRFESWAAEAGGALRIFDAEREALEWLSGFSAAIRKDARHWNLMDRG